MGKLRQLKLPIGDPNDRQDEAVKPQESAGRPSESTAPEDQPLCGELNTSLMEQVVSGDDLVSRYKAFRES